MAKQVKKITLALDMELVPWANYESARRDTSVTGYINDLLREARDNAPKQVADNFKAFMETREA